AEANGNKAAYWRLQHSWREADRIVALGPSPSWIEDEPREAFRTTQWWKPIAIAASVMLMVGTASGIFLLDSAPPQQVPQVASSTPVVAAKFFTPVGGRRVIPLEDGSKMELNTASVVRASITAESRQVWLDQGEAYFEI